MGSDTSASWESVRRGLKKAVSGYYLLFFAPLLLLAGLLITAVLNTEVSAAYQPLLPIAAIGLYLFVHYLGIVLVFHGAFLCTAVPMSDSPSRTLIRSAIACLILGKLIEMGGLGLAFPTVLSGGRGWRQDDFMLVIGSFQGVSLLLLFAGNLCYVLFLRSLGLDISSPKLVARATQFLWFWLGGIAALLALALFLFVGQKASNGIVLAIIGLALALGLLVYALALFSLFIRLLQFTRRSIGDYLAGPAASTQNPVA